MKNTVKKVLCAFLAAAAMAAVPTGVSAATAQFNDSTTGADWTQWTEDWKTIATDYEQVSLTPGADQSQLNFAWYSKTGATPTPAVMLADNARMQNAKMFSGNASKAVDGYYTNQVTVTGLTENTEYYYTYLVNGVASQPVKYTTRSFSSFQMLFVGDPQIGASKGQTVSTGDKLAYAADVSNTAARNDAFSWNNTLNIALKANPNISFVLSAGDQINKNVNGVDAGNEVEYAGYLSPDALKSLPVSTTIGNHDATNKSYSFHFNNPNTFAETSPSVAGTGYYYSYGDALFMVLNTNNYNCADHEALIKKATTENPDKLWRVVMFHQDIYGSGLDHSDSDGMILRTQLTPILDRYDVDVVLQGHDHSYSRSYLLKGDGLAHAQFDAANINGEFDWDNVTDKATKAIYPYYPDTKDSAAVAANAKFLEANKCYTVTDSSNGSVTDPDGVLYLTANSSTGSKFYELVAQQQNYVAYRNQNWKPSYSVISLDGNKFSVATYSIIDGQASQIDSTFTIEKTKERSQVAGVKSNGTSANAPAALARSSTSMAPGLPAVLITIGWLAAVVYFVLRKPSRSK